MVKRMNWSPWVGWEPLLLGWEVRHKKFQYCGLRNWTHFSENTDEKETFFCLPHILEKALQKDVLKMGNESRISFYAVVEGILWVSEYHYQFRVFMHLTLKCLSSPFSPVSCHSGKRMLIDFFVGSYYSTYLSSCYTAFPSGDLAIFLANQFQV